MTNKVLLPVLLFLALCVSAAIISAYALGGVGMNTNMSRSTPSKPEILILIDDESAKQVFASLHLESAHDEGFMDSFIESNWCGASRKTIESLLTSNAFKTLSAEEFSLQMPFLPKQDFDLYGRRSYQGGEMGLGVKNHSDCIKLFVVGIP